MVEARFIAVSKELAETHYAIHKGKPFYNSLIAYITSSGGARRVFLPATLAIVLFGVSWNLIVNWLVEALGTTGTIFRRTQLDDAY